MEPITLLDHARMLDPNGVIPDLVDLLNETNEILDDMTWIEGNLPTGHQANALTGIPEATYRKLNSGVQPTKGTFTPMTDTCGLAEMYCQVDKEIADLNGNTAKFMLSQNKAHLKGMNKTFARNIFYAGRNEPEKFVGLTPRYSELSTDEDKSGSNVFDAGGLGNNNTSVWLIVWGDDKVTGIYPKGSKAGITFENKGQVTLEDANGGLYEGYRTHYIWKHGISVINWHYAVRIANIDVNDLMTAGDTTDTSANLLKLMAMALDWVPDLNGKAAFYMNRVVKSMLRVKMMNKSNTFLSIEEWTRPNGATKKDLAFMGVPCRRCDALLKTEERVTAAV